jgi:hypothetical protein
MLPMTCIFLDAPGEKTTYGDHRLGKKFCGSTIKSGGIGSPIPSGQELDQALPHHGAPLRLILTMPADWALILISIFIASRTRSKSFT